MSEFYAQRRTSIKDGIALVSFILGWFAAGPFAWPFITEGFDSGSPAGGVLKFLFVVFAVGAAAGLGGLALGTGVGSLWERMHRRSRPPAAEENEPLAPVAVSRAARDAALSGVRFDSSHVDAAEFLELAVRIGYLERDADRVARAMEHSVNIGAWEGDRLVGAARVLTDGHLSAALVDIVVDPHCRRRGIGRELMNRAFNATPRGTLLVVAGQHSASFFQGIGCERSAAGYVMSRSARA